MNHEESRGAHHDAGQYAAPAPVDELEAHIAGLPYGVMANDTITPPKPPSPAQPRTEPLRGVPAHVGKRPPSYPPHPLQSPSLRAGDPFAACSPAVLLDGAAAGRLTVRAVSVRGDSHNWEGSCRQDAMTVTRIGPPEAEMLLLAVADGVGSAAYSHIGSYRAARETARHLDREAEGVHAALSAQDEGELRAIANKAIANAVSELRAGWEVSARNEGRPYADQDYATTLHVLLVPTDARIRERVVFSVGDGGLFVLREGSWEARNAIADGGVLDTRTDALPHAYRSVKATLLRTEPGEVLLLGTDGITNPLTQKDPEFARHLADAWGGPEVPSLSDFLWQAQTRAKSYDDDRTVICVWEEGA
ncbi:protein phosphatase 2C domain-containing protein [Streptomyces sp. HUAS TT20]|uniref:protein phosphatase 2C domain-containing protein n=1 Tax=Streptomyces sp. HUAS TT20 TaxID=3447509 RepID=UPI0021DA46BE|nr:protein phosphatase 2C domain-containing protein [Streptomyces sp. HUAS 15-9]UXY31073.1 protein phosphatase 2C domain-containing protein [Streptomyces sp. HUAS 15-9]